MGSLVWGRRQGSARQAGARLLSRGEARMSSRYISHRYGEREEVRSSRATSRASSRAPSMTPSLAGSRASSVLDLSSIHPRATSQAPRGLPSGPRPKRWSSAMEYSKTNIDYYRGKTKSIYEKEPIFRDFARNIPLSQSLDDSSSLHSLKRDFQKLVSARDPVLGRPDPLKPSAGQNRLYQPKSEMLSARHKSQAPSPVILPYIYVYHRDASRST